MLFENLFYKNPQFVKDYNNWKNDRIVSNKTDRLYTEIAKLVLDKLSSDITFTYFDLNEYKNLVDLKRKYDPDNYFRLNQNIKPYN